MNEYPSSIEVLTTKDGSPTLAFRREDGYVEKMHHADGAVSESFYIYGEALEICRRNIGPGEPVRAISVGLGLGYNELIAIGRLASMNEALPIGRIRRIRRIGRSGASRPWTSCATASPANIAAPTRI
ncbi:MAG: hypothetical protein HC902_12985 [Calothrix sp. SM1_5_4]|nr:hypothetical protein [Calothrix sp. SM1_5_4]